MRNINYRVRGEARESQASEKGERSSKVRIKVSKLFEAKIKHFFQHTPVNHFIVASSDMFEMLICLYVLNKEIVNFIMFIYWWPGGAQHTKVTRRGQRATENIVNKIMLFIYARMFIYFRYIIRDTPRLVAVRSTAHQGHRAQAMCNR